MRHLMIQKFKLVAHVGCMTLCQAGMLFSMLNNVLTVNFGIDHC